MAGSRGRTITHMMVSNELLSSQSRSLSSSSFQLCECGYFIEGQECEVATFDIMPDKMSYSDFQSFKFKFSVVKSFLIVFKICSIILLSYSHSKESISATEQVIEFWVFLLTLQDMLMATHP